MNLTLLWAQYRDELTSDPMLVLALSAALVALATTPLAFLVLGRLEWFKARRGRVLQRPGFSSIVVAMLLVMGMPATFAALVIKSRSFDRNRYEFDPNRTWSVLEQGRGFQSLREADAAVRQEMERLGLERKTLVENVKKLDEAVLALRSVANTSPAVAQRLPGVLQSLAGVRKSVGLDGPQQLLDYTAPPLELRATNVNGGGISLSAAVPPGPAIATLSTSAPSGATPASIGGLTSGEVEAELATVPEPQRKIAALLPFTDLPPGWTVGKLGARHLETFDANNLYEKIDGRAESFLQYGVKGMAYAVYHPTDDPSNELQLYIFEMADSLKALGKYGSEKPDEATPVRVGTEGYANAGSTLFYAGRYYSQIISTRDDPKYASFSLELAERVAARQKPDGASAPTRSGAPAANPANTTTASVKPSGGMAPPASSPSGALVPSSITKPAGAQTEPAHASVELSPAPFFALLPTEGRQGEPKYVAQDVFGYSFLSDVFMADYKSADVTWQGFLRPYRDAQEAKAILEKYIQGVEKDGAQVTRLTAAGADEIVASSNVGLIDVVFRKGNTLAGANGATSAAPAEAFSRALAKSLPATLPTLTSSN